jgi:uncharacterized protein DUF1566
MIIKLILTILLTISAFGVEILIDKTSKTISKTSQPKEGATFTRDDISEVVTNNLTGLMWQDDFNARNVQKDWDGAKEHCENLSFFGFDDWYLPTIKELESIIDTTKTNTAIKDGFKNETSAGHWSSSPNISDSDSAWGVGFEAGDSYFSNKTNKFYVTCVRARQ